MGKIIHGIKSDEYLSNGMTNGSELEQLLAATTTLLWKTHQNPPGKQLVYGTVQQAKEIIKTYCSGEGIRNVQGFIRGDGLYKLNEWAYIKVNYPEDELEEYHQEKLF
jgi:hypothetical protein